MRGTADSINSECDILDQAWPDDGPVSDHELSSWYTVGGTCACRTTNGTCERSSNLTEGISTRAADAEEEHKTPSLRSYAILRTYA